MKCRFSGCGLAYYRSGVCRRHYELVYVTGEPKPTVGKEPATKRKPIVQKAPPYKKPVHPETVTRWENAHNKRVKKKMRELWCLPTRKLSFNG